MSGSGTMVLVNSALVVQQPVECISIGCNKDSVISSLEWFDMTFPPRKGLLKRRRWRGRFCRYGRLVCDNSGGTVSEIIVMMTAKPAMIQKIIFEFVHFLGCEPWINLWSRSWNGAGVAFPTWSWSRGHGWHGRLHPRPFAQTLPLGRVRNEVPNQAWEIFVVGFVTSILGNMDYFWFLQTENIVGESWVSKPFAGVNLQKRLKLWTVPFLLGWRDAVLIFQWLPLSCATDIWYCPQLFNDYMLININCSYMSRK